MMKYCPKCKDEFEDSADRCPTCDKELAGSKKELERIGKTVVFSSDSPAEAEFVLAVFNTHNVPASLDVKDIFDLGPGTVFVTDEHLEKAREIVESLDIEENDEAATILPKSCPTCKDDLAEIASFDSPTEAEMLMSLFRQHGVPASVEGSHAASVLPVAGLTGPVKVMIPRSYARRAAKVLEEAGMNSEELPHENRKPLGCGPGVLLLSVLLAVAILLAT